MRGCKGLTLIELIVVMVIVGIIVVVAVPNFGNQLEQGKASTAKNNLLAIMAAQEKYYEDNSSYCTQAGCGDTPTNLNSKLGLHMTSNDPFFSNANGYNCRGPQGGDPAGTVYYCSATDGSITLSVAATSSGGTINCTPAGNAGCPT